MPRPRCASGNMYDARFSLRPVLCTGRLGKVPKEPEHNIFVPTPNHNHIVPNDAVTTPPTGGRLSPFWYSARRNGRMRREPAVSRALHPSRKRKPTVRRLKRRAISSRSSIRRCPHRHTFLWKRGGYGDRISHRSTIRNEGSPAALNG
jgi:hypothetical protein